MIKPQIDRLLYSALFPNPVQGRDPPTLQAHIIKNLVPEIKAESDCFYGENSTCIEYSYPGLDYSNKGHRLRLSRFPYHRRLFRAFDALRLTESEIYNLCRWQGTKWARERFEAQKGVKIKDTTWDGIQSYVPRQIPVSTVSNQDAGNTAEEDTMSELEYNSGDEDERIEEDEELEGDLEQEAEDDSEDDLVSQSIGVELNQRLLAATEARARGEEVGLDAAWEQWLKEAAERGFASQSLPLEPNATQQSTPGEPQLGQTVPDFFQYDPGQLVPSYVSTVRAQMPPPPVYPHHTVDPSDLAAPSIHSAGTGM